MQEFKRTISWNRYRSEITMQSKNNNLDYMNDRTFRNTTNNLFVLSLENGPTRNYLDKYYMLLIGMYSILKH